MTRRGKDEAPKPTELHSQRTLMIGGALIPASQAEDYCARRGLCRWCGETKTHRRRRTGLHVTMEPLTEKDDNGNYTVYKGFCIKPLCYSLEQARKELGESTNDMSKSARSKRNKKWSPQTPKKPVKPELALKSAANQPLVAAAPLSESSIEYLSGLGESPMPRTRKVSETSTNEVHTSFQRRNSESAASTTYSHSTGSNTSNRRSSMDASTSMQGGTQISSSLPNSPVVALDSFNSGNTGSGVSGPRSARRSANFPVAPNLAQTSENSLNDDPRETRAVIAELESLAEEGKFDRFIGTLADHDRSAAIVTSAFFMLRNKVHVFHRIRGSVFSSELWVNQIVDAMRNNAYNSSVQLEGVTTLWSLCAADQIYMKQIVSGTGLDAILEVMESFKGDTEIQERCCGALECCTRERNVGVARSQKKVIDILLDTINDEASEFEEEKSETSFMCGSSKELAIRALYNLSCQKDAGMARSIREALSDCQGLNSVFLVIKKESQNDLALEFCVRLIGNLTDLIFGGTSQMPVGNLVDLLLEILTRCNSPELHSAIYEVVSNIAISNHEDQGITKVRSKDVAEAILAYAIAHKTERIVQLFSLVVLCDLRDSMIGAVTEADVVEFTVNAMVDFPGDEKLQGAAITLLAFLSTFNTKAKEAMGSRDVLDAIISGFTTHVTNAGRNQSQVVKLSALSVLATLGMFLLRAVPIVKSQFLSELNKLQQKEGDADVRARINRTMVNILCPVARNGFEPFEEHDIVLELLDRTSTEADVEILMTTIFALTCQSEDGARSVLSYNGGRGIDIIVQKLESFPNSLLVQRMGIAFLANMYVMIPFKGELNQTTQLKSGPQIFEVVTHTKKEVDVMQAALKNHKNQAKIQSYACSALSNFVLGATEDGEPAEVEMSLEVVAAYAGTSKKVLDAIAIHGNWLGVKRETFRLFWCLTILNDEMEMKRWSIRMVSLICETLTRFTHDDLVCSLGLGIFSRLSDDPDNVEMISSVEGFQALVKTLTRAQPSETETAASILAHIMTTAFTASNRFMHLHDSVSVCLECMDNYPQSESLQIDLCEMFTALMAQQDNFVKGHIGMAGGIDTFERVLKNHSKNDVVVESALRALAAVVRGCSTNLLDSKRVVLGEIFANALTNNPGNEEIHSIVIEGIANICIRDEHFNDYMRDINLLLLVVDSMQSFMQTQSVIQHGCSIIWMASPFGNNKEVIGRAGIRAILNGMLFHISSTAVQKDALTALKNLSPLHSNKVAAGEERASAAIVSSMWVHMDSAPILCAACSALNNIAVDTEHRKVTTMKDGELEAVCFAMKRHPHNEEVQDCAIFLLNSYTFGRGNHPLLRQNEHVIGLVTIAAERFPTIQQNFITNILTYAA